MQVSTRQTVMLARSAPAARCARCLRSYHHTSSSIAALPRAATQAASPASRSISSQANLKAANRVARRFSTTPRAAQAAAGEGQPDEGEKKIMQILTDKFKPSVLEVADTSGGCGSFYSIVISSKAFKGISTIKQHRLVNEELKSIISGIHGLQLKTIAED